MLSQQQLKELLHYEPITGVFTWLASTASRNKIGDIAGGKTSLGYTHIRIFGKLYLAHRLAWLYMTGCWPTKYIDHKNGTRDCNIWDNIRECTQSQNAFNVCARSNNKSGFKGVSFHKASNKWLASAKINGKSKHLGYFLTAENASAAYQSFAKMNHGEFFKGN